MRSGKVWGHTIDHLVTPLIEVHEIVIKPNSWCSMHMHEHKHNMFYVLKGELEIHIKKNDYDLTDVTSLFQGEFTIVKPGEYHQFKTKDSQCIALEIYFIDPINPSDIIRENVGGSGAQFLND